MSQTLQYINARALVENMNSKAINDKVRKAGYPNTQRFMKALEQAKDMVTQYKHELDAWKEDVAAIKAGKTPTERKAPRPQKESIIEQLTRLKKEAQEQPRQRKVPQRSSRDMER